MSISKIIFILEDLRTGSRIESITNLIGGIIVSQYICLVCNFIYYEREGKAWEDLEEDWVCPQCGAPKCHFQ